MSLPRHSRAPFDASADLASRLECSSPVAHPHLQLSELADVAGVVRLAEVVASGSSAFPGTGESIDWLRGHVLRQLDAMRRFLTKRLSSPHRGSAAVPERRVIIERFEDPNVARDRLVEEIAEAYAHRLLSLLRIVRREAGRTRSELKRDLREQGGAAEYFERVDGSLRTALVLQVKRADDALAANFERRIRRLFQDALDVFDGCGASIQTRRGAKRVLPETVLCYHKNNSAESGASCVERSVGVTQAAEKFSAEVDDVQAVDAIERSPLRSRCSPFETSTCVSIDKFWKLRLSLRSGALRTVFAQVDALCRVAIAEEEALLLALVDAATAHHCDEDTPGQEQVVEEVLNGLNSPVSAASEDRQASQYGIQEDDE